MKGKRKWLIVAAAALGALMDVGLGFGVLPGGLQVVADALAAVAEVAAG